MHINYEILLLFLATFALQPILTANEVSSFWPAHFMSPHSYSSKQKCTHSHSRTRNPPAFQSLPLPFAHPHIPNTSFAPNHFESTSKFIVKCGLRSHSLRPTWAPAIENSPTPTPQPNMLQHSQAFVTKCAFCGYVSKSCFHNNLDGFPIYVKIN